MKDIQIMVEVKENGQTRYIKTYAIDENGDMLIYTSPFKRPIDKKTLSEIATFDEDKRYYDTKQGLIPVGYEGIGTLKVFKKEFDGVRKKEKK